jgi:hypothetical protein
MTKLLTPLFLVALSVTLFSCQKEADFGALPGGDTGTGGNTTDSYQPLSTGTWWNYKDSASGTIQLLTVLPITKLINSIRYNAVKGEVDGQIDTAYMASPRPNYYITQKGISPTSGASYDIVMNLLNDTASVGYNWKYNAGQGNGFTALMSATIMEKNISFTANGKTFPNVIHVQSVLSYDIFGSVIDFATYDYYFAKGVGIVKLRTEISAFGFSQTSCTDLVDYSIK